MSHKYKIALVIQGNDTGGGVSSVGWFLYQAISSTERYDVQIFSLETQYNNPINVRLLTPKSWFQKKHIFEYTWNNIPAKNIGAYFSEFEFQRYMPRRYFTDLLNKFDLVQVVSGGPATANVIKDVSKPVCLQVATLARLERKSILQKATFGRKVYGYLMLPIVSQIEKHALSRVDHIFADTEYTRQAILPYVNASKISIDTIGVDTQRFHPIAEEQRADSYILSVGRFEDARKNVALLFEAYALLRQSMPDAPQLILAGKTAPDRLAWARAKELGIIEQVVIRKNVPLDELVSLYQDAAVFALSSDEEGLGIVLLEAMACATPVVSTRSGGPNSVISNNTGFLTPVGDAQALANRILWMLHNPEKRRKMGQNGRRMVESRFSNEVVGNKFLVEYDRLLGVNNC